MNRILRDFRRDELHRLLPLLLLIALLLGYLIFWAGLPQRYALLYLLLPVLLALRLRHSSAGFRRKFEQLPLDRQERIAREYAAPHPCVPLYQGEAHLLSDCLVCQNRRTLLLIPAESIAAERLLQYSGRSRIVCALILTHPDGSSHRLEGIGSQRNMLQALAEAIHRWGVPFEGEAATR